MTTEIDTSSEKSCPMSDRKNTNVYCPSPIQKPRHDLSIYILDVGEICIKGPPRFAFLHGSTANHRSNNAMQLLHFVSLFIFAITFSAAASVLPEPELARRCLNPGSECFLDDPGACCTETCDCGGPCSTFQLESVEPGVSKYDRRVDVWDLMN